MQALLYLTHQRETTSGVPGRAVGGLVQVLCKVQVAILHQVTQHLSKNALREVVDIVASRYYLHQGSELHRVRVGRVGRSRAMIRSARVERNGRSSVTHELAEASEAEEKELQVL